MLFCFTLSGVIDFNRILEVDRASDDSKHLDRFQVQYFPRDRYRVLLQRVSDRFHQRASGIGL